MLKKFVPLDSDVEPSQTPYNIKTFKASDDIAKPVNIDPCSYETSPKPCIPGKTVVANKPITFEEATFHWFEIPPSQKFHASCNKTYEPYTSCVINQRTPKALKHHGVMREKYLKLKTDEKQKIHDGQDQSSNGASLIQMESLLIGKGQLGPKLASPACSMETYYVPSRRLVKKRRDRNTLTFYEKIAVIRHHEANQLSRNNLARMFQCCTTQIRRIIEHKDEILVRWQEMCENNAPAVMEEMSKKRREFEMKAIGFILHQWVERCRDLQLNMVINDATLKMISTKMATVLNIRDFKPTGRWIERFRLKFKYKNGNLSNPHSVDDPQGTLCVEDIIIEFKNFLPSFMRQEISNITSNNIMEESTPVSNEPSSEQLANLEDKQTKEAIEDDLEISQDKEDSFTTDPNENIAAENVLQHLTVIQQFLQSNSDYQAMAVATHLQNYIEQTYILPSSSPLSSPSPSSPSSTQQQTDPDFVILIE